MEILDSMKVTNTNISHIRSVLRGYFYYVMLHIYKLEIIGLESNRLQSSHERKHRE